LNFPRGSRKGLLTGATKKKLWKTKKNEKKKKTSLKVKGGKEKKVVYAHLSEIAGKDHILAAMKRKKGKKKKKTAPSFKVHRGGGAEEKVDLIYCSAESRRRG